MKVLVLIHVTKLVIIILKEPLKPSKPKQEKMQIKTMGQVTRNVLTTTGAS